MSSLKISYKKILEILTQNNLLVEHNIKNSNLNEEIEFISDNSQNIVKNTLFFCKGLGFKEEYLIDAVKKGAVCYESEKKYDLFGYDCQYIIVNNILRSISLIAPLYYGYPYEKLNLIGITGTKGKTTTAHFLRDILDEYTQSQTGLLSSIETFTGKQSEKSRNSTPEPCDLQQFLYEAKSSGMNYFTMEVSSQAYKRDRVFGIKFNNGIFLNIAEDHISPLEHENFEDYLNCKLEFMKNCSNIVINRETDCFDRVLEAAQNSETLKQITLFGSEKVKDMCDYYYTYIKKDKKLLTFTAKSDKYNYNQEFKIKTPGLFNIENAMSAIVMCKTLGIDDGSIRKGLAKTEIPGRMTVFEGGGVTVIVDYAHNLLSYIKLFESLKTDYPNGRIITVGGTPGNKALNRRKDFGNIVGKNSDYIYLTSDDPQYEDTVKICEEIAKYMPKSLYEIIPDRVEAVTKAINKAKSGDVVALIGKGEEIYQKINGKSVPYESDLTLAQNLLAERKAVKYKEAVSV